MLVACAVAAWAALAGLPLRAAETSGEIKISFIEGQAEFSMSGAADWQIASTNNTLRNGYRFRTGERSRAMLLLEGGSTVLIRESSMAVIVPSENVRVETSLSIVAGIFSFFHREKPGSLRVNTRSARASIKGTEFVVAVDPVTEATTISVIEGEVEFGNEHGTTNLTNLQQAVAEVGQAPRLTPGFNVNHVLQWNFYYPGVLDVEELPLNNAERAALTESLTAYRSGDLLTALQKYPANRPPASAAERVYYAGTLLAVGLAEQAEASLKLVEAAGADARTGQLAGGLRLLITAVKRETPSITPAEAADVSTATEALALSYYEQSRAVRDTSLRRALAAAQRATELSPGFGFAWARVAELEFSFGRTAAALRALERSQALSPRNAQALALRGFLAVAQNKTRVALDYFDRALAIDPALGNAWLGRGLCKIRLSTQLFGFGDTSEGRQDLLIAAAVEPQRSLLRSYLGKAWSLDHRNAELARKELDLAIRLDENDPTPWLYRALLNEQENRLNEGIRDLERSVTLNDNRRVYRSELRLDEDRAVRQANLARIYADAGLADVAVREASRSVADDYANFSAHLFLANSYQQLSPSAGFDQRFETSAASEYLLASLLGPASGAILAQNVSQQEYSGLLERNGLGLSTTTEYLSHGAWSQSAVQHGTYNSSSYALMANYLFDPGQSRNHEVESRLFAVRWKQMITQYDSAYFELQDVRIEAEDLAQRYNPDQSVDGARTREEQQPNMLVGWNHEWNEAHRTLLLAGRVDDSLVHTNFRGPVFLVAESDGSPDTFDATDLTQQYRNRVVVNSLEMQHLFSKAPFQTIAGLRFQTIQSRVRNQHTIFSGNASGLEDNFGNPGTVITNQLVEVASLRISPYLYQHWQVAEPLLLIGGLTYDYQQHARNLKFAPVDDDHDFDQRISPKAGFIWTPAGDWVLRGAWSRSLVGVDLDQSLRLEPAQLAGFVQSYKTLFPNSLVGGVGGAQLETFGLALENRFGRGTYASVTAELLQSEAQHQVGVYRSDFDLGRAGAGQMDEKLQFRERTAEISLHQLVGDQLSFGVRYRAADAELSVRYPRYSDVPPTAPRLPPAGDTSGLLHLVTLTGQFRHASGLFAGAEANWWNQDVADQRFELPQTSFWQAHLYGGFRFPRRRAEVTIGVYNVTAQDYRLYPINFYPDLPRERTFFARLTLNF